MNTMMQKRKWLASLLGGAAMCVSSVASAIVVGGVDFGTPGTSHIETTTLAETLINGNGQTLTGYGQVNTVNGNLFYGGSDRLYFIFTDYVSKDFTASSTGFLGGKVDVYLGATFNLLAQSSAANMGIISSYTPWVRLLGHVAKFTNPAGDYTLAGNGTLTGASLSFTGSGILDTDQSSAFGIAAVRAFLNPNNVPDGKGGFGDMTLTTSADNSLLNPHDITTGCQDGTAVPDTFCLSGSADIRGTTSRVPEPGTLALLALGLLGLGVGRIRKTA